MSVGQFEHEIFIRASREKLIDLFSNIDRHQIIHPLIIKVEKVPAAPPVLGRYFITDQLALGPVKFKIVYRADVLQVTESEIHTEAWQSPGVHVINHSYYTPESGGTRMREQITIEAPWPVFGYTFQQAKIAHQEMLKRIKNLMENTPG